MKGDLIYLLNQPNNINTIVNRDDQRMNNNTSKLLKSSLKSKGTNSVIRQECDEIRNNLNKQMKAMLKKGSATNIFVSPTGLEMNRSKSVVSITDIEEKIFETLASMTKPVTTSKIDNKSTAGATTPTISQSEKNKRRNIKHKSNKSTITEYTIGSYQLLPTTANLAIVGFIDIETI
jgi:hypothetical protein